jgi:hypothetical protein
MVLTAAMLWCYCGGELLGGPLQPSQDPDAYAHIVFSKSASDDRHVLELQTPRGAERGLLEAC